MAGLVDRIRSTLETWRQILMRTRKPYPDEFNATLRIVLLLILGIGVIGFAIHIAALYGFGGVGG